MNLSQSVNESFDYDVIPQTFTKLAKGGAMNGRQVEGIVFQNGRIWNNENTYLKAIFNQSAL